MIRVPLGKTRPTKMIHCLRGACATRNYTRRTFMPRRTLLLLFIIIIAVIYPGLVVTDYSKRYRNNQTMAELMYRELV